MFPYPSGKLHLGHLRVYTIADVVARYHALQGRNVLLPMGWDAFGLPAENAAIERGVDPAEWTTDNIARMKEQLQMMNASFDWTQEVATYDPEFYKHTQKIFLLLLKHGLVSRKKATVNWDPVENTVLANEQVDADGRSWRSGAIVEQRELEQWFLHITEFKESLLRDLTELAKDNAWPERVLSMQKNWLGKIHGAYYQFPTRWTDSKMAGSKSQDERLEIFTTRPETIFAAQFLAISPNSQLAEDLAKEDPELRDFLSRAKTLPQDSTEGYRIPSLSAISPLSLMKNVPEAQFDPLPVYVAPYVRGDYETAAVMGVPAHDARDFAFWKRHNPEAPIKYAIRKSKDETSVRGDSPMVLPGHMTSLAGEFQGSFSDDVAKKVVAQIKDETQLGRGVVKWKIRDWLISRQRYWGTPIPIIHCDSCGPQPVPEDQLPVKLPRVGHHWADGRTGNPLEAATDWVNTTCPKCCGAAKRDTDTMDTFMDSSWYYMRFPDPRNPDLPISEDAAKRHLPVDIYIGGVEHAILHLLYARFVYKAVMGLLYPSLTHTAQVVTKSGASDRKTLATSSKEEPFKRLITQGMVHGKTYTDPDSGRFLKPDEIDFSDSSSPKVVESGKATGVSYEKMSKSKHNGVDPGSFISKYGADATRAHILFQAPVGDVLNWDEDKIAGVTRWVRRVHQLVWTLAPAEESSDWDATQHFTKTADSEAAGQRAVDADVWRTTQNTIVSVTKSMENIYSLNTAVSDLMNLTNVLIKHAGASKPLKVAATAHLLRMLAPIAPAVAEEFWSMLYPSRGSIFERRCGNNEKTWPTPDGTLPLLRLENVKCAVQVNGRLRCVVEIPARPVHVADGPDFRTWITEEILRSAEAREKLRSGAIDIRAAKKVFPVKNGKVRMPRLPPSLIWRAHRISPHLAALLPACRDLASARNELRWIREHVSSSSSTSHTATTTTTQKGNSSSTAQQQQQTEGEARALMRFCRRRGRGVPLQYVLGSQPFGPLDIRCRPGVLIPRPETEAWVVRLADLLSGSDATKRCSDSGSGNLRIVDFCSGTGCVALLLLALLQRQRRHVNRLRVYGFDVEPRAVALGRLNLVMNLRRGFLRPPAGEEQSVAFERADVFSSDWRSFLRSDDIEDDGGRTPGPRRERLIDVLVSNPPYISAAGFARDTGRSVRNHEPRLALVPDVARFGRDGYDCAPEDVFYSRLLRIADDARPGVVALEVGDLAQAVRVVEMALWYKERWWESIEIWRDWPDMLPEEGEEGVVVVGGVRVPVIGSGNGRVVLLRNPGGEGN
ncbi:hypothetical protein DL762_008137 [Monosporascus cannonballus]|uniref:leucine--tRNA ligase n=1 Tax=Monosporascus cannonballus TaxID=155416 RepID=A0ABY0GX31_9PEZI|nr:hypothetical protein DL762_008137 [Monosporascus cannonballus]